MRKQVAMFSMMAAVVGLIGILGAAAPTLTIKQAMQKIAGKKGALPVVKAAIKSESPDWKSLQASTKVIADSSAAIVDAKPSKGEKADFEVLAKALAGNAKDLHEAAEKEDLAAVKSAAGKIGTSCKACHDAHKGQSK